MVYLVEMDCVLEADVPYVATIHDVLHRSEQRFAEAFVHGSAAYYDRLYAGTACRAAAILVHDETVKADLLQYYGREGVQRDRIHVLPLQPAPYLRHGAALEEIREHYGLPVEYLFCPARLWPHKNHLRLLEALRLLKTRCGMVIPLVLTGFDSSDSPPPGETPLYVLKQAARERGLDEQVRYLGMVPDAHVAGLYEGARALVMPTFCPPLAIPVFEAWALGCPVVTSDLRGIREPAGDAAITVDPASSDAIAEGIARVWTDEALRATLTERGRERAAAMTPECHAARLSQILAEAKSRMAERPYPACEAAPA